jgi:lipopolysaccharide assembly outer membrane protein LptD (OstA)
MRYDTCLRRGVIVDALTDFQQGGATWYMRGTLAVDSNATRLYGASSNVTTCEAPVAHYHFAAREVKWINKTVMVARPAVLYVRDVPILWLPFIVQDIRSGRRSGILVPNFGLNDLVRTSPGYERHVANLGYFFAISDYTDLLTSADWYAGRSYSVRGQLRYRWLNRFVNGGIGYSRLAQLDQAATSSQVIWQHNQSFDSRTATELCMFSPRRSANPIERYLFRSRASSPTCFRQGTSSGSPISKNRSRVTSGA